ncbi:Asp-tRNA(Asn)/Glu-tRNA(Gln) amidotransferase subunit GatC [Pedobacter changchengzhani]|uniref:Aspartyl/glutamyl-tRNA(Asn/Gln) amidotransferase subunit C n=1 Tax=Pedobacter changchengzhani TaxID=2529274 RepID=A0A4V3A072_9SPHI|nr:Asp-tRNA(Asn)/Glu-tRNA(Gln) amidotransferase subunit GatC [Pedobacter changchengzhani]TDG35923.1 Asp-tRNA(Asn)/Glu-tRNA(Gln) amidotransferase subunit GatC [Pedobacter changchengzhani]
MILDAKAIYKIADLARIHIEEKDVDTLIPEMNKILSFMEKLNELDTANVAPLVYMNETTNIWRQDVVKQEIATVDGLKNAAKHDEQFFMVPKIIEK